MRRVRVLVAALGALGVLGAGIWVGGVASAGTAPATSLPACPFWAGDTTAPPRTDTPFQPPAQQAPELDVSGRLAAPAQVSGTLSGGSVTITIGREAGAAAYRIWRNGVSVAWISDWGQSAITATDTAPCEHATYTVMALSADSGADSAAGQLSHPWQLSDAGTLQPWATPVGQTIHMMVTSYNDTGQTATGYLTSLGVCAVDPRVIPWGTRFYVPGYGYCYAADIGLWIRDDTVDVWLPGSQANGWGVQHRDIQIVADS
jgi:3D (Asp-Asp-Asp) domain-containing protein